MMQKILNIYRNVLFVIAMVLVVVLAAPMLLGIKPYVILSGSMEPEIHVGSLCYVKKGVEGSDIVTGDVIAFDINGTTVVHRVNEVVEGENCFVTKGDNNENVDAGYVTYNQIIGRELYSLPYAGYAIKWATTSPGYIIIIGLVAISIVSSIIYNPNSIKKQEETDNEKV